MTKLNKYFGLLILLSPSFGVSHSAFCQPPDTQPDSLSESQAPSGPSSASIAPFSRIADVEIKSICGFLDQKWINVLSTASRQCHAGVRANEKTGLDSFKQGRKDTLYLDTSAELANFLENGTHQLYAGRLEISICSDRDLNLLLENKSLQKSLKVLTLYYAPPYIGESFKENLAELLVPFKRLTAVRMKTKSFEPTRAFSLVEAGDLDAFKSLIIKVPKNLVIRDPHDVNLAGSAARKGKLALLGFLALQAPELLREQTIGGSSVLHLAAMFKKYEALKFLIVEVPDFLKSQDETGNTPLHYVAEDGNAEIADLLAVHAPESLTMQNKNGDTPAHLAVHHMHWKSLKILAKHAPNSLKIKGSTGLTVIEYARAAGAHPELIQFLEQERNRDNSKVISETSI